MAGIGGTTAEGRAGRTTAEEWTGGTAGYHSWRPGDGSVRIDGLLTRNCCV